MRARIRLSWEVVSLLPPRLAFGCVGLKLFRLWGLSWQTLAIAGLLYCAWFLACGLVILTSSGRRCVGLYARLSCRWIAHTHLIGGECCALSPRPRAGELLSVLIRLRHSPQNRIANEILIRLFVGACLLSPFSPLIRPFLPSFSDNASRLEFGALVGTALWVGRAHILLQREKLGALPWLFVLQLMILFSLIAAGFYLVRTGTSPGGADWKHLAGLSVATVLFALYRWIALLGLEKMNDHDVREELKAELQFESLAAAQLIFLAVLYFLFVGEDEKQVLSGFVVAHFVICAGLSLNVPMSSIRKAGRGGEHNPAGSLAFAASSGAGRNP